MLKELAPSEWFPGLSVVLSVDEAVPGPPSHSVTSGQPRTHTGLAVTDASTPRSQFPQTQALLAQDPRVSEVALSLRTPRWPRAGPERGHQQEAEADQVRPRAAWRPRGSPGPGRASE